LTRNKFVIRTSNLEDDEEELKKHNELIILVEAVKYCETIGVHRIRYSKLKQISNNKLAALTHGEKVDFGGSFEVYLLQFEKKYQYCVGLIERTKEGGKTYIVPDVKKIAYLFDKLRLNDLFEEERYIRKPILIEYDDNYLPSEGGSWTLMDIIQAD
jgi:hypothetical protein